MSDHLESGDVWKKRYQGYSLDQLSDALAHIDARRYPERADLLRALVAERKSHLPDRPAPAPVRIVKAPPRRLPRWMLRGFTSVRLTSAAVGFATVLYALTGLDIGFLSVWVNVAIHESRPGGWDPSRVTTLILGVYLLVGAASHFPRWRFLTRHLAVAWGLLSIQIFASHFVWVSEVPEQVSFKFSFDLTVNELPNVYTVLFVPAVLAVWSLLVAGREGPRSGASSDDAAT